MTMTFLADYKNEQLDADYSEGSPTATFVADRDATHPATYFDANGVMQKTTTANVGRFNYGYYDTTGWHKWSDGNCGVTIEGASTNYLAHSIFDAGETLATGWSDWHNTASAITYSLVDVSSTFNVGTTVQSQRMEYTGEAGDSGAQWSITNTLFEIVEQDDYLVLSVYVKGSIPDGIVKLLVTFADSEWGNETQQFSSDFAGSISSTEWRKFTFALQYTGITANAFNAQVTINIQDVDNAETIDIQVACFQLEKSTFATSFIPTTSGALTRNWETLKYPISGNRNVTAESMVVKLAPEFASNLVAYAYISATDGDRRDTRFGGADNDVDIFPNETDTAICRILDLVNENWTANTEMTLGHAVQHSSPYIAGYYDGVADGTNETTTDFADNTWGTYFWVGSNSSSLVQLNGTIFSIAFFNEVLSASDMLHYYNVGWSLASMTLNTGYWGSSGT